MGEAKGGGVVKLTHDLNPGADWADRVLILWQEDDALPPDREMANGAFRRITGEDPERASKASVDYGDSGMFLKDFGWVLGWSCEGGFVGVVVRVTRREKGDVL